MMTIYQLLPRLYTNRTCQNITGGSIVDCGCGKMNDITTDVLLRIRELGITHVWYTGVLRHATKTDYSAYGIPRQNADIVKGEAGSPYAITDYYDVDPDLATSIPDRMQEWEALISRTHQCGMKVVMDFVPNHVAREYRSVCLPEGARDMDDENFYLIDGEINIGSYHERPARATGNDVFHTSPSMNDWYETVKLNYEHHDTWEKMVAILIFWASKGVDAFRCDMAEMVTTAFWTYAIGKVKAQYPQLLFIAEVYNPRLYRDYIRSGFDYLYDKVGMYDCLRDVTTHRRPARDITWQWQATDDISGHMLYFLENHDEQRIASDFFVGGAAHKALPAAMVSILLQSNPFMIYMGQELGEPGMDVEGFSGCDGRTTIFDYWTVGSLCRNYENRLTADEQKLRDSYTRLLHIATEEQSISQGRFFDLMYVNGYSESFDDNRLYAFIRKSGKDTILVVLNFADEDLPCKVNIPQHAFDYLQMEKGTYQAVDLITSEAATLSLSTDSPVETIVPARSGRVYKFAL